MTQEAAASALLRAEHRLIEEQIDRLEKLGKQLTPDTIPELRDAYTRLHELAVKHFAREEGVLYPYLRAAFPALLTRMDEQHEATREVDGSLGELLAIPPADLTPQQLQEMARFAIELHDDIQHHIVEEEDDLLRLADERLCAEEQSRLAEQMSKA